jgi:cytochrome P450
MPRRTDEHLNPDYEYLADNLFADFSSRDPTPALARTAEGCPFQRVPQTHAVLVLRAGDVSRLLADDGFGSRRPPDPRVAALPPPERATEEKIRSFFSLWPVFSDGDYHDQVRRVVVRGLRSTVTPAATAAWEGLVTDRIESLGRQPFDWIETVCRPLARQVVATLVGEAGADLTIDLGRVIMDRLNAPSMDVARTQAGLAAIAALRDWLRGAVADPPTALVAAIAELWWDSRLGPDSATAVLAQLVTGAFEPTIAALGVVAERVDGKLLADLPIEVLREEVLRIAVPFRFASRFAVGGRDVGPYHLQPGERIILGLGTANFDSRAFAEPLACRRRAGNPRGFSFGRGRHYCPGAPLARSAIDAVLRSLARIGLCFSAEIIERHPELSMLRYRRIEGRLVHSGNG